MKKPTQKETNPIIKPTIFVCQNCNPGEDMLNAVQHKLGDEATIRPTRCTGGCGPREKEKGFASIAFVAKEKDSCLFHTLTTSDDDMDLLADFFAHYNAHPDGRIRVKEMSHPRADGAYFLARLPHLPKN